MFKLPALPSPRADIHELADFAELLALQNESDSVSVREILAYLGRAGDNEYNEGVDDEDDINADALDEVMMVLPVIVTAFGLFAKIPYVLFPSIQFPEITA